MRPKNFAVVHKADDELVAYTRAKQATDLESKYPLATYSIHDMTGKGGPPSNVKFEDITVDGSGDWEVKKSQAQLDAEAKAARNRERRVKIINLKVQADKAQTLGPDYADIKTEYDARVAVLESEIEP